MHTRKLTIIDICEYSGNMFKIHLAKIWFCKIMLTINIFETRYGIMAMVGMRLKVKDELKVLTISFSSCVIIRIMCFRYLTIGK